MLDWNTAKYRTKFERITAYLQEKVSMGLVLTLGYNRPLIRELRDSRYVIAQPIRQYVFGYHVFCTGEPTYTQVICPELAFLYCSCGLFPEVTTKFLHISEGQYHIRAFVPHYVEEYSGEITDRYGPISIEDVPAVTEFLRTQMDEVWRREGSD